MSVFISYVYINYSQFRYIEQEVKLVSFLIYIRKVVGPVEGKLAYLSSEMFC